MAVAGSSCPAQFIKQVRGEYLVIHTESRQEHILPAPDVAATLLISTGKAWIRSRDRQALQDILRRPVRALPEEHRDT